MRGQHLNFHTSSVLSSWHLDLSFPSRHPVARVPFRVDEAQWAPEAHPRPRILRRGMGSPGGAALRAGHGVRSAICPMFQHSDLPQDIFGVEHRLKITWRHRVARPVVVILQRNAKDTSSRRDEIRPPEGPIARVGRSVCLLKIDVTHISSKARTFAEWLIEIFLSKMSDAPTSLTLARSRSPDRKLTR